MNWKSHAPTPWKIATLKSLIKRAFLISSTQASLEDELIYLKRVFCTNNDYPPRLIDVIIKNERCQHNQQQNINDNNTENIQTSIEKVNITLNLPYAGDHGHTIVSKLNKYIKKEISKGDKEINVGVVYNT